jgi:hypothetical protein
MSVTCFLLGLYGASAIVFKNGQYAVSIVSEDNDTRAIALSETVDFTNPTTTLNCTGISEMTNISEASLPLNLDDTDGSHNGKHYIAYTFYVKNVGTKTINLVEKMSIDSALLGADAAIRVRVYKNGQATTYAKMGADGMPEYGTTPFKGVDVFSTKTEAMASNDIVKYTIVIWLEGNDPECLDNVRGGAVRLSMSFTIEERPD